MTFDRARIKETAKAFLKRSHWMVVLAVLIVGLLGGYVAGGVVGSTDLTFDLGSDTEITDTTPDVWVPDGDGDGIYNPWEDNQAGNNPWDDSWDASDTAGIALFLVVFLVVLLVVFLLAMAWSIFMGNVMAVGGHGWMLRYWRGETPSIGELFASFRIYKPAVGAMFVKDLYCFLWSLLFIIPGIVKGFAYSMVPYIIYENPNLTASQAIKMSEKMTDGYKGDLFVFNLSYFGWHLLSGITGGIVGLLYVNPYIGVAHAGVYEELKWNAIQTGRLTWADFGQLPPEPSAPDAPYSPYPPYGAHNYGYVPPAGQYPPPAGYYPPTAGQYHAPAGQYTPSAGYYPPSAGRYQPPVGYYPPPPPYVPPAPSAAPPAPPAEDTPPPQE